jgi:carboxyl-terminal processing protease
LEFLINNGCPRRTGSPDFLNPIIMMSTQRQVPGQTWWFFTRQRSRFYVFVLIILVCFQYLSCSKKGGGFQPTDPLGIANKWVYDSMKFYYYWSDQIKENPDYSLPTQDFFKQLLSAEDRFSWISNRTGIEAPKTTAQLFGFHYAFIPHPFNPQQLAGVITLVVPNSDADSRLYLKRGMFFTKVNDKIITGQNMAAVKSELESNTNSNVMLQLAVLNAAGTALNDSVRVAVPKTTVVQKAVYSTRYFQKYGIKTGYLPYFLCAEKDDAFLLQKIQALKTAGITELILDLRYNPGGSVASASKLAATLVTSFNANNTFITYRGNRHGGTVKLSFKEAIQYSANATGRDMNYLQSLHIGLARIFILTSGATASAAELLANNLKPYMPVKLIGEKTLGKDEASFTIEDTRNPRQVEWILMPTIYKVADANGNGHYSNGLTPDYAVNEFSRLPLAELGMPGDLPVDKALELVYGTTQVDATQLRMRVFSFPEVRPLFYSSQSGVYPVIAPN